MKILAALATAITICAPSASAQALPDTAGVAVVESAAPWWSSELNPLVLDGHELHASLVTEQIDSVPHLHVPRAVLRDNPQLSTDTDFIEAIARSGSHGRLGAGGNRAALYALYRGESEVGFYGLEAASRLEADRLEGLLRGIWAHNESLDRARVHRGGKVVVVVWTDGVSASSWEAVNAVVAERLASNP